MRKIPVNDPSDLAPGQSIEHSTTAQDLVPALSTCTFLAKSMINVFVYYIFFGGGIAFYL